MIDRLKAALSDDSDEELTLEEVGCIDAYERLTEDDE